MKNKIKNWLGINKILTYIESSELEIIFLQKKVEELQSKNKGLQRKIDFNTNKLKKH